MRRLFSLQFSVFGNRYFFTPKFTLPTLIALVIILAMGFWYVQLVNIKSGTIEAVNSRTSLQPISVTQLNTPNDWRYYPVVIQGTFDNAHQILVDQRSYQGQMGYDVLTPFRPLGSDKGVLVNRGWIPATNDPTQLPDVSPVVEEVTVTGQLIQPPRFYFSLVSNFDHSQIQWPLVIRHIDTPELSRAIGYPLYTYMILLSEQSPYGYVRDWKELLLQLQPQKDLVTAVEWFGLAVFVIIAYFFLNTHRE